MTMINSAMLPFLAERNATLAVTAATAAVGPILNGDTWMLQNVGTVECFVAFGDVNVTVAAGGAVTNANDGGMSVQPGAILTIRAEPQSTYVAGITAASATTLRVARGSGV